MLKRGKSVILEHIKNIIFDADDTLWENNIYYLKATNDFFDLLESEGIDRQESEKRFNQLEFQVVQELGYGSVNFVYILEELFEQFKIRNNKCRIILNSIIEEFNSHKHCKPRLFENVPEIFKQLSKDFHLYILTKGDYNEQESKIIKSGLSKYIGKYFILDEKDDSAYANLLSKNCWLPEETCMVGNSPKSDINPALRNNMYAIHIPYRDTWKIDIEPIVNTNGKFKQINSFKELAELFLKG